MIALLLVEVAVVVGSVVAVTLLGGPLVGLTVCGVGAVVFAVVVLVLVRSGRA